MLLLDLIYCVAHVLCVQVALLEVDRAEEFSPIKNAEGQGVSDTAATAQEMLLSLHKSLASRTDEPEIPIKNQDNGSLSLLRAYYSGASMNQQTVRDDL